MTGTANERVVQTESALDLESRGGEKGSNLTPPGVGEALARSEETGVEVGPENESLLNEDGILPVQPEGTDLKVEVAEEGKESLLEEEADGEENGCQHDDDYEIPLPLRGRQFANIDTLHDALETLGLTDYKFQLDSEGYVTIPDTKHNEASDLFETN
ncbi:hypothetical protein SEMRO_316_G115450.1 [Seminavis robusta]|uniref:Uncharacterized protein n=1 Tax=Seminavis robusta TaxID=568900 RepID=A0A9N8DV50_9STRA|nr:hypothetical protein SEMRO_316_G115450.1 [Seminavis robusta]|eukprot:Sro316_g115450.1 n/a (158) ;mRNA; r:8842-9315